MSSNEIAATENGKSPEDVLFPNLSADNESGLTEVSSLCLNCQEEVGHVDLNYENRSFMLKYF